MSEHVTTPGDLGRRLTRRREELHLSREQLAVRADLDPGYLGYLEETAASPTPDTVRKLAGALETSVEELLGTTVDPSSVPHPHLEKLTDDECLRLVATGGVGRVAFDSPAGPTILPVNYVLHDNSVIVRTAVGGPLDANLRTGVQGVEFKIAFEIDRLDETAQEGWSVLIRGAAHHVSDDEQAAAAASGVRPWAGGERELYLRITPTEITGRRIRHTW